MLLFSLACGQVPLATNAYDTHPQTPRILRDVATVDDDVENPSPYVPGHRTTMDGRVALRVQGATADIDRLSTNLSFFLFAPEKLDEPILQGPAGPEILADTAPFDVEFPPALDPEMFRLGHHAICDPTTEFPEPGEQPNPYACGDDGLDDCYDLHVISSTSPDIGFQLWGTPVTVVVSDPKTSDARIADITLGEPVEGAWVSASTEWTEPSVTSDGRLMTGRLGRLPRDWTNPETGETLSRYYDLAYSLLPDDAEPCDITGWTDFHPMSHAPYDPDMVGVYGLAAYPFRDTEGNVIADGEDLGGTYPWVDREGANVFMTGVPGRISEQSETRYPRSCVHEGCDELDESVDHDRGFQVAGLWTHGKFVHLDGRINHLDWAVGVSPETHWNLDLYVDDGGEPVSVRVGGGRFVEQFRDGGPYPDGYTHNANVLDSLQNVANFWPAARPVTPRDVVWVMSSGVATDEIAFDDLLDPNALIVSNMQATVTQVYGEDGASLSIPDHNNGQVRTHQGLGGVFGIMELDAEGDEEIHLQNGATSPGWKVPAYGSIEAGAARVEPVALGGVNGRGLWLSGDAAVVYAMPEQPAADQEPGYIGVFVDSRADAGELRELLRFPDGSGVVLDASGDVVYVRDQREMHTVSIDPVDGWVHLGWRVDAGHRAVTLLVDGMPLDRFEVKRRHDPMFSFSGGDLVVGRHSDTWTGFRGWIDDFVVLLHDVDPEVACNHAMGSLVTVADGPWATWAAAYPEWAHAEVADAAGTGSTFACWHDHTADHAINAAAPPEGTSSVRGAILFPEGPLQAGAPRPDSSENAFCLSCHTEDGVGSMHTDALQADASLLLEDDPRRQPSQPPRRVFGNIPAGWIPAGEGPGSPAEASQAPDEGALIDHWVLPASD
ncbi:MAG: hypothetical protein GY913_29800 [Proteobacteria bacterium]|nr:hypothetical protein [Pseudomonadota bacterium]